MVLFWDHIVTEQCAFLHLLSFFTIINAVLAQLVINVKNNGGDVVVESINGNTTADTVILEFHNTDDTYITQFIDFRSEVQIFRFYVLWEEERGIVQNSPHTMCFITRFVKSEFISSDAMSKLRQKNPTAIRSPEEEKSPESYFLDLKVDIEKAHLLSPHVNSLCTDAKDNIHTRESDIKLISKSLGKDYNTLMSAVKRSYPTRYQRCKETPSANKACLCRYDVCIGWYPCGLKYCRGKDASGKIISYRCGIKTCKRCFSFEHVAKQKIYCLWDDL